MYGETSAERKRLKHVLNPSGMKGPLVTACIILAGLLIAMSFCLVLFPENIETIGYISAVVAFCAIAVLVLMLVRMKRLG